MAWEVILESGDEARVQRSIHHLGGKFSSPIPVEDVAAEKASPWGHLEHFRLPFLALPPVRSLTPPELGGAQSSKGRRLKKGRLATRKDLPA